MSMGVCKIHILCIFSKCFIHFYLIFWYCFQMLCTHKPGCVACFSKRIFSSLALSSALIGTPHSSRGIIFPWKGHLRNKGKEFMTSEWKYIYKFFRIACALILESSGKTLRLVIRHRDPINITCKHIQNIKEIIRVICVFVLKRQYILPPLRGVVTNEWCSCCIMFAVYAIPLSCYSPI